MSKESNGPFSVRFDLEDEIEAETLELLKQLLPKTRCKGIPTLIREIVILYAPAAMEDPAINNQLARSLRNRIPQPAIVAPSTNGHKPVTANTAPPPLEL